MTLLCRGSQFVVNGVGELCGTITPRNTPLFGLLQFITNNTNPPTVFSYQYHCHPQSHLQSISNNKISFDYFKPNPLSSSRPTVMSTSSGISTTRAVSENGGGLNDGSPVFALSEMSLLKINKGDITKWFVDGSSDAIVNPANEKMLGGGGADGAIHRAAGPELRDACYAVPEVRPGVRCPTGEARITPGFRLPASHVIHTVGPVYDLDSNPQASLRNSYSLTVAKDNNIKFIAFPAISCGVYGYPFEEAAMIAISTVKESANDFKEVHFVLFSDDIYNAWLKKAKEVLQS